MRYCRWFRQFVRNGVDILENVFFFRWGLVPFKWTCKFTKFQVLEQWKFPLVSRSATTFPENWLLVCDIS
jgi:tellurite resistance protein TehA-like permease